MRIIRPFSMIFIVINLSLVSSAYSITFQSTYHMPDIKAIDVKDNLAYLYDNNEGLHIVDISNPQQPVFQGKFAESTHGLGITVHDSIAYLVAQGSRLQILNVSNPNNPILVNEFDDVTACWELEIYGQYAFVADGYAGIRSYDIVDPTEPRFLSVVDTVGYSKCLTVYNDYVFSGDPWNSCVKIYRIIDSSTLVKASECPVYDPNDIVIHGDHAYVAATGGLTIINIANIDSPFVAKWMDLPPLYAIAIDDGYCYTMAGKILKYNIFAPDSLQLIETYDLPMHGTSLKISGDYLYTASSTNVGMQIFKKTPSNEQRVIGTYNASTEAMDVLTKGNVAYVRTQDSLLVLDISDYSLPTLIGGCKISGSMTGMDLFDEYVAIANYRNGLKIVDVSIPTTPSIVGSCNFADDVMDVCIRGDYAFTACEYRMRVIDISIPSNPRYVTSCYLENEFNNITTLDTYALATHIDSGLCVIDISNPAAPELLSQYKTHTWPVDVVGWNNTAYVSVRDSGVLAIDISDPSNPVLSDRYETPGISRNLSIFNNSMFVCDGLSRVSQLELSSNDISVSGFLYFDECPQSITVDSGIAYCASGDMGLQLVSLDAIQGDIDEKHHTYTPPNEARCWFNGEDLIISYNMASPTNSSIKIDLYNIQGIHLINSVMTHIIPGKNLMMINCNTVKPGMVLIDFAHGSHTQQFKITKF